MGCCLVALVGALWPRIVLVALWLADHRMLHAGFDGMKRLWPVLGFILLPTTTLTYAFIKWHVGSIDNLWLGLLALAFLHDVGTFGGLGRRRATPQGK